MNLTTNDIKQICFEKNGCIKKYDLIFNEDIKYSMGKEPEEE